MPWPTSLPAGSTPRPARDRAGGGSCGRCGTSYAGFGPGDPARPRAAPASRVGRAVAAAHTGLDARPQLHADDGVGGADAFEGPADGLADGDAGAFGVVREVPWPPAETGVRLDLVQQPVGLGPQRGNPVVVAQRLGLRNLLSQLAQPGPVLPQRHVVEHLLWRRFVVRRLRPVGFGQVERRYLDTWVRDEGRQVADADHVVDDGRTPLQLDPPAPSRTRAHRTGRPR